MEIKYLEKKIKKNLIKKKFKNWNKESINFLASIYNSSKYHELYDLNLILLDDYISWYKKNNNVTEQYSLEKLIDLYCLINTNIYKNIYIDYKDFLMNKIDNNTENRTDNSTNNSTNNSTDNSTDNKTDNKKETVWDLSFFIIFALLFLILKCISSFIFMEKKEEKKHIFEIKLPIPDNLLNNPLIKYFLGNNII
jgi:hypothetical protein